MPGYEAEAIVQPSHRLGTPRTTNGGGNGSAPGIGLGLSIVRAVARAHGGDARAQPREGGGLMVTVTLPA